jgi:Zn-dependent protease with chaperone function
MRAIAALFLLVTLASASASANENANANANAKTWTPRSVDPSTPITKYELPSDLRAKAEAHAHVVHLRYVVGTLWSIAVLVLVLYRRVASRLQAWAERHARRRFFQACLFAPAFLLTIAILELPIEIWSHVTSREYGLSVQGWGSFARDWAVGQLLGFVLGTFLIWLLYAIMRKSPRRWWLFTWLAMLPVLLFVVFIQPFVIEPLFFKFAPLDQRNPTLVDKLQSVAIEGGAPIPRDRMFVMDASEKLHSVNAYVTGIGAGKRVVVWDTTLQTMTDPEIAFVFGHELGHYVLGHVVIGLVLGAVGLLVALFVGARLLGGVVRRRGERWGIARPDDFSSLPVVLLILSVLGTVSTPLMAAVSRRLEHQADAFGLRVIERAVDDPHQAAAHGFQRLGEIDLAEPDPSPLVVWWLYDHPAIRDRINFVLGR